MRFVTFIIFSILGLFLSRDFSYAQNRFIHKNFGNSFPDSGVTACATSDGNIVSFGHNNFAGGNDLFFYKSNPLGDSIWYKNFDFGGEERAKAIIASDNNSFIWAGSTTVGNNKNIIIGKGDQQGAILWSFVIDNGFDDDIALNAIYPASDGGAYLAGWTSTCANGCFDSFIIRVGPNGNVIWQTIIPVDNRKDDKSLGLTLNSTDINSPLWVVGMIETNDPSDGYIMQINKENGRLITARTLDRNSVRDRDEFVSITSLPDGNMVLLGNVYDYQAGLHAIQILKVSPNGAIVDGFPVYLFSDQSLIGYKIIYSATYSSLAIASSYFEGRDRLKPIIIRVDDRGLMPSDPHIYIRGNTNELITSIFELGNQFIGTGISSQDIFSGGDNLAWHSIKADYTLRDVSCLITPFNQVQRVVFSDLSATLLPNVINQFVTDPIINRSPQQRVNDCLAFNSCCPMITPEIDIDTFSVCAGNPKNITVFPNDNPNFNHRIEFIHENDPQSNFTVSTTGNTSVVFLKEGIYNVVRSSINNITGCEYTYVDNSFAFYVAPAVKLDNLPRDTSVCPGQVLRFNPVTNISNPIYEWSNRFVVEERNNPNTQFITTPGIITNILRVTDPQTGCYDEDTVQIIISGVESNIIPANLRNATLCQGTTLRLNTVRAYQSYEWSPAEFLDNPNVRTPIVTHLNGRTLFRLKVLTDIGCEGRDSIYINNRKLISSPVNDTVLCEGSLSGITLAVRPDSSVFCNYRWLTNYNIIGGNLNSNTITVNPTRDTCYVVTANCPNGCILTDTLCIRIRQPLNIVPPQDVTLCRGQSTTLFVQGGTTYEWFPSIGLSNPFSRQPIAKPDVTTTYTVNVFDALGCLQAFTVTVTVNSLEYFDIPSDTTICLGASIRLSAGISQPHLLYFWDPQIGIPNGQEMTPDPVITPPTTQQYIVEIINMNNNCSRLDTITIKVTDKPNGFVIGTQEICGGEKRILRAYGADRFFWVNAPNPGFFDSLEVSPTDDFTYKIVPQIGNCNGDTIFHTITVTPRPVASFDLENQICARNITEVRYVGTIRPNEIPQWHWDGAFVEVLPNGDPLWGPFSIRFNSGGAKRISLKIISSNGCMDSLTRTVVVADAPYVSAGRDIYSCSGEEVVLESMLTYSGSMPCSFIWTPSTGLNNPTVLTPMVKVSRTTTYILRAVCGACSSAVDTVRVIIVEPPAVFTDTHLKTICAGGVGVGLETRVQDGEPPYFYEWSPTLGLNDARSPSPIANPTIETTYYVKVIDANGCESMPSFTTVRVNPVPLVSAGPDRYLCSETKEGVYMDGKVLNREGSYEYRWNPTTGLADPDNPKTYASPLVTTIYTLTVRNRITGCSSDSTTKDTAATIVINVDKIPFVDAGPEEVFICKGDSVQIGSSATETGPDYRYVWSPSTGLSDSTVARPFAKPDITTTYFFTAYAGDCQSLTDKITVSIKPFPVFSLENYAHICLGDTHQVKININNNKGPFTVQWTPVEGLSDPTALAPKAFPLTTTVYRCTIITTGCDEPYIDSVIVRVHPRPQINLNVNGSDLRLCLPSGDSLYLAASIKMPPPYENDPIYFEWKPTTGLGDSTDISTGIKPSETTTYTVTVKTGRCSFTDTITVFVLPFVLAKINADTNDVCILDTIRLTGTGGTGGASFVWRFRERSGQLREWSGDGLMLLPDTSGWLILTVSEGNCIDQDSLFIKARTKPQIKIDHALDSGCDPLTVRFYTDSFYQADWTWDFGDNTGISNIQNPFHTYQLPGSYEVKLIVRSPEFCEDTIRIRHLVRVGNKGIPKIFSDPPAPVTLYLPFAEVQFVDSSIRAKDYFWEFGDGITSILPNPNHKYVSPGSYTVRLTITDSSGCRLTAFAGNFEVKEPEIIIPNVFTPNGDGVNDNWDVQYLGSEPINIQIFDRFGVLIYSYLYGEPAWNGNFQNSGSQSAEGVYFYMIKIGNKIFKGDLTLLR